MFRPFKMFLVEPILLLSTIYLSVAYGVIYASPIISVQESYDF
jgi:hypothetical protein